MRYAISSTACLEAPTEELVMSLIKSNQIDPKKIAELTRRLKKEEEL